VKISTSGILRAQLDLLRARYDDGLRSRPLLWWRYSAPEQRQRLGGIGTPLFECVNSYPEFIYGVPRYWRFTGDHLSGGVVLSESDPPRYESEPQYLRRLGLLQPGELRRIPRDDFNPNVIRRRDGRVGIHRASTPCRP
jgi:hypothetical protein